jgi:hypothetical protein
MSKPVSVSDGRNKHLGLAVPSDNAAWDAVDAEGRDLGRFASLRAAINAINACERAPRSERSVRRYRIWGEKK